jgi:predicted RNA-binding Zn-ribbon protein involved in translation (DUF1610 family)
MKMALLLCFCCGRQREVKPLKKGILYSCSNCGAKKIRIIRSRKHGGGLTWADGDGVSSYEARHKTYAGLRRYAEYRGYKKPRGWCANKFLEIFGRWPNGEAVENAAPASSGLLWWIRQQNAAYRKRKREEEFRLDGMATRPHVRDNNNAVAATSVLMSEEDWSVKL